MCRMCEGASRQDVIDEARLHIIHHGWFLQGILPGPNDPASGWVYTVGLVESFDHPELVVTNISWERGRELLNALGELVRAGENLRGIGAAAGLATVREVHPNHFDRDLVNMFIDVNERLPRAGEYLQIVPDSYCTCCRHKVTDLSQPHGVVASPRSNRAQRRAATRQRRRKSR